MVIFNLNGQYKLLLLMHLLQQMQWPSLILILVLALALAQSTSMKFSALAVRQTSLTALKVLLSAVLLSIHMQEYDVKVCCLRPTRDNCSKMKYEIF